MSNKVEDTENIGLEIGEHLNGNEIISLYGGLGAGKTSLTRGIARAFGLENEVHSPTFSIVNEYKNGKANIFHFDMYRIGGLDDLESTGFYEYLNKGIVIIEWSENISEYMPIKVVKIFLECPYEENSRKIKVEGLEI